MKRLMIAALTVLFLCGCAAKAPLVRDGVAMDTTVRISLYDRQDPALLDECFSKIAAYDKMFSRTAPDSEISKLNTAGGAPAALSKEVCDLLATGKVYGDLTDGALDITIAPVSSLWDFHGETVPDEQDVAAAVPLVDHRLLTVSETGAALPAGMAVDVGAIAKGYAADRLADYLREQGVTSALIDLGGNIYALGEKSDAPFVVGIRDPLDENGLCATVQVSDLAVVTSGVYERGFTKDGVRYHHLLDPETGWPVQNGLLSVTIVCDSATEADALSTACFVMGRERGMALIENLGGVEALFVGEDGTLYPSSGLQYEEK